MASLATLETKAPLFHKLHGKSLPLQCSWSLGFSAGVGQTLSAAEPVHRITNLALTLRLILPDRDHRAMNPAAKV